MIATTDYERLKETVGLVDRSARGIERGAELELMAREPFEGPLTVRAAGREHSLGESLARAMRVEV